ncbi:MAG: hypothetical protein HKM02_08940 [Pseudomonadales bacterium]|nr:hypothetical protein [Pseudomonadales bacterium]
MGNLHAPVPYRTLDKIYICHGMDYNIFILCFFVFFNHNLILMWWPLGARVMDLVTAVHALGDILKGLPLATLDAGLAKAAARAGIPGRSTNAALRKEFIYPAVESTIEGREEVKVVVAQRVPDVLQ